jgi:YD repeat-containing protein
VEPSIRFVKPPALNLTREARPKFAIKNIERFDVHVDSDDLSLSEEVRLNCADQQPAQDDLGLVHTFDDHGNLIIKEQDSDNDGVAERRWTYTYEPHTNKLLSEFHDGDADGNNDELWYYTYHRDGHLSSREYDHDANGTIDSRWRYAHDADGKLISEEWIQSGRTGEARIVTTYFYEGEFLVAEYEDIGGDGFVENTIVFEYDNDGRLIAEVVDVGNDGYVDNRKVFVCDALKSGER